MKTVILKASVGVPFYSPEELEAHAEKLKKGEPATVHFNRNPTLPAGVEVEVTDYAHGLLAEAGLIESEVGAKTPAKKAASKPAAKKTKPADDGLLDD